MRALLPHLMPASREASLRWRFLLSVLVWSALAISGIWYSATRVFERHIEKSYHEELEVHVKELAGLLKLAANGTPAMHRPLSDPRYLVPHSGFYWQVTLPGHDALRSPSLTHGHLDESVAQDSSIHHRLLDGPTGPTITYGILQTMPNGERLHVVIATDKRLLDEAISGFTRELTVWLTLLTLALLLTGVLFVSLGLRPLDRLTLATARLRRGEAARLEGIFPREIAPLVHDLNAYIEQNNKIVERARVEAGNLAHALRTPLAIMTDEAERLAHKPGMHAAAKTFLDQGQAMVQQIEFRLARARSAAGIRGPGTVSRIDKVMPPILSAMQRLHPDRHFRYAVDDDVADLALPVDPVDLSEVISTIVDNAGKWAKSEIEVRAERGTEGPILTVSDDGPGIRSEDLTKVFDIGARFDTKVGGNGLGLAIAREITDAYGMGLVVENREESGGLRVTVSIPSMRS